MNFHKTNLLLSLTLISSQIMAANQGTGNLGNNIVGSFYVGNTNTGSQNVGSNNNGSGNVGGSNTGTGNVGSNNTGSSNVGSNNNGSSNVGGSNTGSNNAGSNNNGTGNLGSGNDGSGNLGTGNTGSNNAGSNNTGTGNLGTGNNGSGNLGTDNTGSNNVGTGNNGSQNVGVDNNGSQNVGVDNNGSQNVGVDNNGSQNVGVDNNGSQNVGVDNNGSQNVGVDNNGSQNVGVGNNGSQNVGVDNNGSQNAGSDNNGSQNAGSDNNGSQNAGSDNNGSQNAGSDNNGSQNAGSDNNGSQNAGSDNNGSQNAGSDNNGSQNAGSDNNGSQNAGSDNNGSQNAGSDNNGSQNAGSDNNGSQNAGSDNNGSQNAGSDNNGSQNAGSYNNGSQNAGSDNNGSQNAGSSNTGSQNTGDGNFGSGNTGDNNFGSGNQGRGNQGSNNSGNGNIGSVNTGAANFGSGNRGNNNNGSGNHGDDNYGTGNQGNDNYGVDNQGHGNEGNGNVGNNNEGNDNRGSNNRGNDNIGNGHVGNRNEDEWHLQFETVVPVFFGNIFKYDQVVNLSSNNNLVQPQSIATVEFDRTDGGYSVVRTLGVSFGAGAAALFNFPKAGDRYDLPANMIATAGVGLIKDTKAVYRLKVATLNELKERKLHIPRTASELKNFKDGEAVTFETENGLFAYLGLALYGVGVAPTYSVSGRFETTVKKISNESVFVEFARSKLSSVKVYAGVIGVNAMIGQMDQASKVFSFVLDLSKKSGKEAYEALFSGNVAYVQKLALLGDGVDAATRGQVRMKGKQVGLRIAVPMLPILSWDKTRSYTESFQTEVNLKDDTLGKAYYGMHMLAEQGRAVNRTGHKVESFYGGTIVPIGKNGAQAGDALIGSKWHFEYADSHGTTGKLKDTLADLTKKTQLTDFIQVKVPQITKSSIGFTKVSLEIDWGQALLTHLMELAWYGKLHPQVVPAAKTAINSSKMSAVEMKLAAKKVDELVGKISEALVEMKLSVYLNANDFARGLGQLGRYTLESPYLFKAMFVESQKCGINAQLNIAGEKVSQLSKSLTSTRDASCLAF